MIVLLLALSAGSLQQGIGNRVQFAYDLQGDSIVAVESGATVSFDLYAYDNFGYGVDSFAVRIPFDATRLAFVSAATRCPDSTSLNVSSGTGFVVLSTPSCSASYFQVVTRLTFRLLPGVSDGTIIGLQGLATIDNGGFDRLYDIATDFAQICHASGTWGDIDGDAAVNSRDALIALSNAVGFPTGGFNVSRGDVDADGQVTSRDALGMLSASIGLPTNAFRVGKGIADACARQPALPRPLYFVRYGGSPFGIPGVSGLAIRAANDSSVTVPGDNADVFLSYQWRPRVSPDGNSVLFVCLTGSSYPAVCKANADGSGATVLSPDFNISQSPDWSPAGDSIVFVMNNAIWIMGADGSGIRGVSGPNSVTSVAWSPTGRVLAYTRQSGVGTVNTFNLDTGGDFTAFSPTLPASNAPRFVDWNLAGDSLLFDMNVTSNPVVASVPAAGGAFAVRYALTNPATHPVWTDQGVLFVAYYATGYRIVLGKNDGTYAIVSHDTQHHFAPGMKRQ